MHAVPGAGCGHATHCGPLVLFRVVQENLVSRVSSMATCSASGVVIMMVQYYPALTSYHELANTHSQSTDSSSCRGQAGHQLPGAAPVLLQGLSGCQVGAVIPSTHYVDLHNKS